MTRRSFLTAVGITLTGLVVADTQPVGSILLDGESEWTVQVAASSFGTALMKAAEWLNVGDFVMSDGRGRIRKLTDHTQPILGIVIAMREE